MVVQIMRRKWTTEATVKFYFSKIFEFRAFFESAAYFEEFLNFSPFQSQLFIFISYKNIWITSNFNCSTELQENGQMFEFPAFLKSADALLEAA